MESQRSEVRLLFSFNILERLLKAGKQAEGTLQDVLNAFKDGFKPSEADALLDATGPHT